MIEKLLFVAVVAAILAYAAVKDYKTNEIPNRVPLLLLATGTANLILQGFTSARLTDMLFGLLIGGLPMLVVKFIKKGVGMKMKEKTPVFGDTAKKRKEGLSDSRIRYTIAAALAFLVSVYVSGLLAQYADNFKRYSAAGGFTSSAQMAHLRFGVLYNLWYGVATHTGRVFLLPILIVAAVIMISWVVRMHVKDKGYDSEGKYTKSGSGEYGTSGWMDEEHIDKVYERASFGSATGIMLGEHNGKAISLIDRMGSNKHIAVFGPTRSGKTTCFSLNNIIQCVKRGESFFATSTKSDLYENTSEYLKDNGYVVKIFDLVDPEHSDSWNCLSEVRKNERRIQENTRIYVDTIMKNTTSGKVDYFWNNAESSLLTALVYLVALDHNINEPKTMARVYNMITNYTDATLANLFRDLPANHPGRAAFSLYNENAGNDKVTGGVKMGLGGRLSAFGSDMIQNITSYDDIDLSLPAQKKCAYFVRVSDQDSANEFLASLFFSFAFIDIVQYVDANAKKEETIPVNMILDEFCNLGVLPNIKKQLSTVASRKMNISIIIQNIPQLKGVYPNDEWRELLGNCDTQLFLGCSDDMTADYISKRSGDLTIDVSSETKSYNTMRFTDYTHQYRESKGKGKRLLMTPAEALDMKSNQLIISSRGEHYLKANKLFYTSLPESCKFRSIDINDYVPEWRKLQEEEKLKSSPAPENVFKAEVAERNIEHDTEKKARRKKDKNVSTVECGQQTFFVEDGTGEVIDEYKKKDTKDI